jgi:ribosomal protein L34E
MAVGEGGQLVAKKNRNGIGFRWALIVVLLLGAWTVSLAVPRPKVVFHGGPRWIGENVLVGIPVLCAFALFTAFIVHRWQTRDQRKLERLTAERLRAERTKIHIQRELEHKRQTDELKRRLAEMKRQAAESRRNAKKQEAELRKQGAELRKQEVREAIKGEVRLREERLRSEHLA